MTESTDTDEKCIASCKDGSDCNAYPIEGSDKCRMHAGTSADGESHASNKNNLKTGLHADPVGLFDYLIEEDPDAARWIMGKVHSYSERAPLPVFEVDVTEAESLEDAQSNMTAYGDDLLQMCVRDYAKWQASKQQLEDGIITQQHVRTDSGVEVVEDSNPVNLDLDRMDRTTSKIKGELGLHPDMDGEDGDAAAKLKEAMVDTLREMSDQ